MSSQPDHAQLTLERIRPSCSIWLSSVEPHEIIIALAFPDKRGPTTSDQDLTVVRFLQLRKVNLVLHLSGASSARPELGNSGGDSLHRVLVLTVVYKDVFFVKLHLVMLFRSKTVRFDKLKDSGTPGPGSYKQPESFRKQTRRQQRPPEDSNTSVPPVTWVRVTSAPSIPTRGQSYGYEEGKFGELVMQKAP